MTKRPLLGILRIGGAEALHMERETSKRTTTKSDLLELITELCNELAETYKEEVDACAHGDRLKDQLYGVQEDARRAEAHCDKLIRDLEAERQAHRVTTQQAARAIHGQSMVFGKINPHALESRVDVRVDNTFASGGSLAAELGHRMNAGGRRT